MNLPRRRMADTLLPLIRLQNTFADGSAIVRDQKTLAPFMVVPSMPAAFKSLTMVCTSGSSGISIQVPRFRVPRFRVQGLVRLVLFVSLVELVALKLNQLNELNQSNQLNGFNTCQLTDNQNFCLNNDWQYQTLTYRIFHLRGYYIISQLVKKWSIWNAQHNLQ